MELYSILSIAISTLVVLVLSHVAVFWVVRSLYPPAPQAVYYSPPANTPIQVFTEKPIQDQTQLQAINVPTYEAPVQLAAANEEGATKLDFLSSPPANGDSGLVAAHA